MARPTRLPSYRLHKPSGQAIVVIRGRMFYLGRYGSLESRAEYQRILAEWLALGPGAPAPHASGQGRPDLTVNELVLAHFRHAESYYVKDGQQTAEVDTVRQALKPVRKLYGHTLARDFGPLSLKACQDAMVAKGWSRTHVNRQTNRVKRMFSWAVANELLPVTVYQALATVPGLRRGRTAAKESPPVRPAPDDSVEKTLGHLSATVAAMVRIQRLTGMRPQEVVSMRTLDIDVIDPACWVYRPGRHKTEHHDRERVVFIGPQAQAILKAFLRLDVHGPLFSPRDSEAQRSEARRAERKTKLWPSHVAHQARKKKQRPERSPGDSYTVASYRRAIHRACVLAGVEQWSPHQLRHSAGTRIRRHYGLEAAQAVLGHAELGTTQIYAERDLQAARRVMLEIG